MQAQRKPAPVVGRDGIAGSRGSAVPREQDLSVVELDATFGRLLGLSEGQKVYKSQRTPASRALIDGP